MLVNLLIRLFPVIQQLDLAIPADMPTTARMPRWNAMNFQDHLSNVCDAGPGNVRSSLSGSAVKSEADLHIQVGRDRRGTSITQPLYVGSSRWEARLSPFALQAATGDANPVGAYVTACLAAGEVWKNTLNRHEVFRSVPIFPLNEPLTFSAFTYLTGKDQPNPPLHDEIDIGRISAIGLGAGGGATIYTLASVPSLRGSLELVDPDEVEPSNLNRYVFASRDDTAPARKKVDVLQGLLNRLPNLTVHPYPRSFREVAGELTYEYVAAAVHSRSARRDIQYATPKVLWDAGATGDGEFRVWRLRFGESECMWCKHPYEVDDPEREAAEQLAELLGLSPTDWQRKHRDNEPFTANEIAELHRDPDAEWDLPVEGERFGAWYAAQCGRMELPNLEEEIPVPFAPVMAGVLIAGEIIKERHHPEAVLDSYYWNTLVGKFIRRKKPEHRFPRSDCRICQDPVYRDQYERRWNVQIGPSRMK